jgi:hypothetical protein
MKLSNQSLALLFSETFYFTEMNVKWRSNGGQLKEKKRLTNEVLNARCQQNLIILSVYTEYGIQKMNNYLKGQTGKIR